MRPGSYEAALLSLAHQHEEVVVMTAENRAHLRGLPAELGPRFIDVGIAEQTLVGAAAGLALRGRRPVVHALAAFLVMRAFEFVRTDVGLGGLPVKLVGMLPGLLSEGNGPTHQAIEDVALMRAIPGMQVFCPADEEELVAGLPAILASPRPCYVRYTGAPAGVIHTQPFALGRAEVLREGGDVALLSYGTLVARGLAAARELAAAGIGVQVVNLRSLEPLDEAAVIEAAQPVRLVVTLEDHLLRGGIYSIVCELLVREGLHRRVLPIGFPGRWFTPLLLPDLLVHEGLDASSIARRVAAALPPALHGGD